jgi:hypothetical protein
LKGFGVPPAGKVGTGGFIRQRIVYGGKSEAVPVLNINGDEKFRRFI